MTLKIYCLGISAAALLAATIPMAAQAQYSGVDQSASVGAQASAELRGAIKRLASNSSDTDALIDAGNAALLLGDANAALNFFTRADALRPSNSRIKLGLATASVRSENPFEALRLFDEAVRLGMPERALAADRALAFDLLGNFDRAQMDYKLARSASSSNDLIVRQAISLSLGGKYSDADKLLLPLLQQNDGDAWRARAFLLAARGDYNESVKVARGFMDARSAQKIEVYLRQMPKLTGAQQAAAIHLGHFPASDIGRDSSAIQSIAGNYPAAKAVGAGRLVPSGDPLGPKGNAPKADDTKLSRKEREKAAKQAAAIVKLPAGQVRPVAGQSDIDTRPAPNSAPILASVPPMPIDIARDRIMAAEKASANLVAIALPVPAIAAPAAAPPVAVAILAPAQAAPVAVPSTLAPPPQFIATPKPEAPPIAVTQPATQPAPVAITATTPSIAVSPPPSIAVSPLPSIVVSPPPSTVLSAPQQQDSVPAVTDLNVGTQTTPVSAPAPAPASAPASGSAIIPPAPATAGKIISTFNLGEVVSAIEIPESEKKRDVVPVDLKKLDVMRPKPVVKEAPKADKAAKKPESAKALPAKPEYPARYWVQVATGDLSAFPADMRNFRRKSPDLFKGKSAWTSPWSKSNRLVIGPFENLTTAKKWEAEFRKSGGGGFVWQSGDGTQVTALK